MAAAGAATSKRPGLLLLARARRWLAEVLADDAEAFAHPESESAFVRQLRDAPVTRLQDRHVLLRVLASVAWADGRIELAERALLAEHAPELAERIARPDRSPPLLPSSRASPRRCTRRS